ncbi:MAG: cellulase family glycosylhydrolase [Phycisphaerales bacterium]|nr:MAG: cellulase family glycosylhydrolase [Phycisphaerales bacterium]
MRRSCRCSLILCVGLLMAGSGAIVSSGSGETRLAQHHETDRSIDPDRIAMTGCAADGHLSPMTKTAGRKRAAAASDRLDDGKMEMIRISRDGRGFEFAGSGQPFRPWGHNYGPDFKLLEDNWTSDWSRIAEDFSEMKAMGANVVRVHLQLARFMDGPDRPNRASLAQLRRLIRLAEETGLYLDITGLGCYRTTDVPAWYDGLSEKDRWAAQARFWDAVAAEAAASPAVFCYDLMNEPVSPGGRREPGQWYSGKPFGGFDFIQWISLDQADRPRHEIACAWIRMLSKAIRKRDKDHLITVGLLPSTPDWGHFSGFVPEKIAPEVDFIAVHIYPNSDSPLEAIETLKGFAVGKPLVIEETFPLSCTGPELRQFLLESRGIACGWIGHYGGTTLAELDALKRAGTIDISQELQRQWLELFQDLGAVFQRPVSSSQPCSSPS